MNEPVAEDEEALAEDIVRFFESLSKATRADYEALAALDRQYGEDADRQRLRAKS